MNQKYTVSHNGKFLLKPIQGKPVSGDRDIDYTEDTFGQYYKFISNNWLNRNWPRIKPHFEYTSFILATFGVSTIPIILGVIYRWPEFVYMPLALALFIFQIYFYSKIESNQNK